jgi:hypothetical protein
LSTGQVPRPESLLGVTLPADVAEAWHFDTGRPPALGLRSADGLAAPARLAAGEPIPISVLMADLHRLDLPAIDDRGNIEALVSASGMAPTGSLAKALRQVVRRPWLDPQGCAYRAPLDRLVMLLLGQGVPPKVVGRYALADLLAQSADAQGRVDLHALRAQHGPDVDRLVTWLGGLPKSPRIKQQDDTPFTLDVLDPDNRWRYDRKRPTWSEQMFPALTRAIINEQEKRAATPTPLLDLVVDRYGPAHPDDVVVLRQHVFSSTAALAHHLGRRHVMLGKNYSASLPVMLHEKANDSEAWQDCFLPAMMQPVVEQQEGYIDHRQLGLAVDVDLERMLRNTLLRDVLTPGTARPIHKINIVDEGAGAILALDQLLKTAASPSFTPESLAPFAPEPNCFGFGDSAALQAACSGVEHTRDGVRQLRDADLGFGVVNVAECPAKLLLVGVLIGWSVVEEITRLVADLKAQGVDPGRRVLINGYGSTGSYTAKFLRACGYEVVIKEPDPERARIARERDGFGEVIAEVTPGLEVGMVVGCVGMPSLTPDEMKRLRSGTVLVSASSSTKEFLFAQADGWEVADFRDQFETGTAKFGDKSLHLAVPGSQPTHWHRVLVRGEQELMLVNSGYPINFTGGPDSLEPLVIELTRALLLLGSLQARQLPPGTRGLVPLDAEGQVLIAERWMAELRALQPPLPQPVRDELELAFQEVLRACAKPQTTQTRSTSKSSLGGSSL